MSEEQLADDQSHYEISLTAGQAFMAFVLMLLSLAASFAFGLMIGRGQSEDRLVVKKEPAVITEASALGKPRNDGKIVELGVDDFKETSPASAPKPAVPAAAATDTTSTTVTTTAEIVPAVADTPAPTAPATTTMPATTTAPPPSPRRDAARPAGETPARPATAKPVYAQLLSTIDQKTAEALAAKLIDGGFTSAYVDRAGTAFKVRVRFPTEAEARAAESKLREFAKDVWIVK